MRPPPPAQVANPSRAPPTNAFRSLEHQRMIEETKRYFKSDEEQVAAAAKEIPDESPVAESKSSEQEAALASKLNPVADIAAQAQSRHPAVTIPLPQRKR